MPELARQHTDGVIDRSTTRDTPYDTVTLKGRAAVWNSRRGNHLGQRSRASATTGRTYGRKRSDQNTAKSSCEEGAVHICVVINADAHIAGIGANVVDAIGNGFAQFLVDEVMHIHFIRTSFRPIVAARVLVVADQLFLLGIDRDDRLAGGLEGHGLLVDVLELSVTVGMMMAAFLGLAIHLAAVVKL